MGVKQGCILSALLFILYINDITDAVQGGINFFGVTIPALMYADDIVFLSDSVDGLQRMINRLDVYCKNWNLTINLQKSKIMVFRDGGGRYSSLEKWKSNGEDVEIVRKYKYLGMIVSANLNLNVHLEEKLADAKRAISSIWERCIKNNYISHSAKQLVFRSTATSILLYGAQVWGYRSYESVEKFLRYFLKRMFRLPKNAPNYMLYIETGTPPMFLRTLEMHFNYVIKVLEMEETRIPNIILRNIIRTSGSSCKVWKELASECGVDLDFQTNEHPYSLREKFNLMLEKLGQISYKRYTEDAGASLFRNLYSKLNYYLNEKTYFLNCYSVDKISTIFKMRGEIVNLNFIPHRTDLPIICELCNMRTREDVFHFLAVCPILKEFRVMVFSKDILEEGEALSILNGENGWDALYNYTIAALRYRKRILEGDF